LGIPQSVFDAIRAGEDPELGNERERVVYDLAKIAMAPGAGPDEVFARAERLLGRNGIAEVLALLGYYSSVAMAVKVHRVPVPA
jgi:4-carboxymuconolactone decarboxylase